MGHDVERQLRALYGDDLDADGLAKLAALMVRPRPPVQRRRAAVANAMVARHRRRYRTVRAGDRLVAVARVPLIPRSRGCARAVRPRSRARRSPRATRAGPDDDSGPSGEAELAGGPLRHLILAAVAR